MQEAKKQGRNRKNDSMDNAAITIVSGESGSGKSTWAREFIAARHGQKIVRINRDDLRAMFSSETPNLEREVAAVEKLQLEHFLSKGYHCVIDNTHLSEKSVNRLITIGATFGCKMNIHRMETSLEQCIANDDKRTGKTHVGEAVIHRQFLMNKRLEISPDKKIILCDIDGTLADHKGIRSPYDEIRVLEDKPFRKIINIVNDYHKNGYIVIIVSGRHSTCGEDTIKWLHNNGVLFDYIFMRHAWQYESDVIIKQQILDELLKITSKDQIVKIFDDRKRVVEQVWMRNNLPISPVYNGEVIPMNEWVFEHSINCTFTPVKGFGSCPICGALEDF